MALKPIEISDGLQELDEAKGLVGLIKSYNETIASLSKEKDLEKKSKLVDKALGQLDKIAEAKTKLLEDESEKAAEALGDSFDAMMEEQRKAIKGELDTLKKEIKKATEKKEEEGREEDNQDKSNDEEGEQGNTENEGGQLPEETPPPVAVTGPPPAWTGVLVFFQPMRTMVHDFGNLFASGVDSLISGTKSNLEALSKVDKPVYNVLDNAINRLGNSKLGTDLAKGIDDTIKKLFG